MTEKIAKLWAAYVAQGAAFMQAVTFKDFVIGNYGTEPQDEREAV